MRNRQILLGVTGGIAAYKSAELCRLLIKSGATVQVIMSEAACRFITPLTLETLSGRPVQVKMFERPNQKVAHIDLAETADLFIIAPATADYLARSAAGRAEDLISAVTLAFDGPILAAPAMNSNMWRNPATQRNIRTLVSEHGWQLVSPETGELACGWTGPGRMAEPAVILTRAAACFKGDLKDKHILVTAGPTVEDIDPVRFLSNRSTGRMGYAVAGAARARGAEVSLVSGPTPLSAPAGVRPVFVRSALEMEAEVNRLAERSDAIVMAAAVADFRPVERSEEKMKKARDEQTRSLSLVRNPDILAGLGRRFADQGSPVLVGFALETGELISRAEEKLKTKRANLIVANLAKDGFGGDDNRVLLLDDQGNKIDTGILSKDALADLILDEIVKRL
jgi:phosphopantothenoylcysteine decarboxylase / phosphopantothenate---cysteine ligase